MVFPLIAHSLSKLQKRQTHKSEKEQMVNTNTIHSKWILYRCFRRALFALGLLVVSRHFAFQIHPNQTVHQFVVHRFYYHHIFIWVCFILLLALSLIVTYTHSTRLIFIRFFFLLHAIVFHSLGLSVKFLLHWQFSQFHKYIISFFFLPFCLRFVRSAAREAFQWDAQTRRVQSNISENPMNFIFMLFATTVWKEEQQSSRGENMSERKKKNKNAREWHKHWMNVGYWLSMFCPYL